METRLNEKKPEPLAPQRPQERASTAVLDAQPAFGADAPPALTFQAIAALQGTAGNAAVAELLGGAAHPERKLPAETDHAHGPAGAPSAPGHEPAEPVAAEPEADLATGAPPVSAGSASADLDGPPHLGETVPEIAEPHQPDLSALGRVGHQQKPEAPGPVGDLGAPERAAQAGGFEQETQGIAGAAAGGGGGGLLDSIIEAGVGLLQRAVGSLSGSAETTAGAVGGRVSGATDQVSGLATGEAQAAVGEAHAVTSSATTEAGEHVGQAHDHARAAVTETVGEARQAPAQAAGPLESLVAKVLEGAVAIPTLISPVAALFAGIFQRLPGALKFALTRAQARIDGLLTRTTDAVSSASQRLGTVIARAGSAVEATLDWVAEQTAGLRRSADEHLAVLPDVARNALQSVVDRVLGAVARAAALIAARARRLIDAAVAGAQAWLQSIATRFTALIARLRTSVDGLLAGLRARIDAAVARIAALKAWLLARAAAFIARAIRAVIGPIYQRALDHLIELIGPEVEGAVSRAELLFPNGMPAPPEVHAAAAQASAKAGPSILSQIKQGLLNPEGDHISIGFQYGGSAGATVGVSGGVGASLEAVFDYRRNDIGFFVSPAAGGQVNLGDVGATGHLSGVGGWGTVASFGEPDQDVMQSWSGWFTNATYGAQAGVAVEGGLAVATGGSFYRSGAVELDPPLVSYTPLGAGHHTVKGEQHPDTFVPGTPSTTNTVDVGEVKFASQQSEAEAQPGGAAAMDTAAEQVKKFHAGDPRLVVAGVSVAGEASRIWRHPRPGKDRASENADLAVARANNVKAGLDQRLGGDPPVSAHGAGDRRAQREGRPVTDGNADYRRAVMFADVNAAGTPDHQEPGKKDPDHEEPNTKDVKPGLPNPFTSARTAYGWDTTVGVSGLVGAAGQAGLYGGIGVSYSFPIGKTHCTATAMEKIRIAVGIVKVLADALSMSPLGLLRDSIALFRGSVAADAQPAITHAVNQWVVPMPAGVQAA